MSVSSPDIDTERTRALRERMATELVDSGALTDKEWRPAFTVTINGESQTSWLDEPRDAPTWHLGSLELR